ncbi:DUF1707 SHOCT-like domain-containing protein [Polymorphospora rubra]|uniref:DUF1707 domain-containing protein n=1 Tax=Polymorphospora rubra TaxID=338584 RepID=A0A810MX58_9ACTN|nr:hypothetical protein Prubr_15800 [Polymorphospora rubra]
MDRREDMRAADSDREAVAEQLRVALGEGRLDLHEYDERLQRVYLAKTYADLDGLLSDLPGTIPAAEAQLVPIGEKAELVAEPDGRYPHATRRWLADTWDGYGLTVGIVVGIWAVICLMTQELMYFWPGWVAGPWGAVLIAITISGLVTGEPQKWAAKEARKRQAKAEKKARKKAEKGSDFEDDD